MRKGIIVSTVVTCLFFLVSSIGPVGAETNSGSKESESNLKKALLENPADPRTNLELGLYYYNRQIYAEARDYFENLKELTAPGTEYSSTADRYLDQLPGAAKQKRLSLGATLGQQYDSNIIVNPDNSPLPAGITRKSDWKTLLYLNARFKLIDDEHLQASVGDSFYQTFNYTLHDFNITENLADLSFLYRVLPGFHVGGTYKFEYILVGGNNYDSAHHFGPSFIISEGKGFFTEVQYVYRYTSFKDSDLFRDNSERSGPNNSVKIQQTIPLGGRVKAQVGYAYDKDLARVDFWRYAGNKAFANIEFNVPCRVLLTIYGEYYHRDYEGISPFSDKARRDNAQTYSISATKSFSDVISATLAETHIHNGSNIDVFNYKRSLTTLLFNVRF